MICTTSEVQGTSSPSSHSMRKSSAAAMRNGIGVAKDMVDHDMTAEIAAAIRP